MSLTVAQAVIIEPITTSPGIYFDPIGYVRFSDDYLHVLIPTDISYIQPHIQNINSVIGTTRFLCQQNNAIEDYECHNILEPLTVRYKDIVKDYSAISHLIAAQSKRSGSWLPGIGTIFKHIIGTMDENDALRYDNAIRKLHSNDKQLANSLKDLTMITKSALRNYNDTLHIININEARLNSSVEELADSLKNISLVSDKVFTITKLNQVCNNLYSSLLALSFKIEDLQNAIMLSKSHVLHPSVLTPRQLFNELIENVRKLPRSLEIPTNLELDNIHVIIDISEIGAYYSGKQIIFVCKIPLVHRRIFDVYKSIPIPTPHNFSKPNSYSLIIPTSNYVALSKDKFYYCFIDNLLFCKRIPRNSYICQTEVVNAVNNNPSCETELMLKVLHSLPKECNPKFVNGEIDIWHKLNNNQYLYVQSELSKLMVDCDSKITEYKISGTGFLNLPSNCTAICKNTELIGKVNLKINLNYIQSDFNITNDPCCDIKSFESSKIPRTKIININLDKLKDYEIISNQIVTSSDKILEEPNVLLEYQSTYPILTFCLLVLVIFVICFIVYEKFGKRLTILGGSRKPNPIADGEEMEIETSFPRLRTSP